MEKLPDPSKIISVGRGAKKGERRDNRRVKLAQAALIRPSGYHENDFSEVLTTVDICRNGIYVRTERTDYKVGMRLFVTTPYSDDPTALRVDYLARVVRVDELGENLLGIAIHLLSVIKFKS
jgi:hypothetical protein